MACPKLIRFQDKSEFPIEKTEFTIGRSSDNDYVACSTEVSRKHCILMKDANSHQWYLKDMSSNGTVVNSQVINKKQVEIKNGDIIKFGMDDLDFTFVTTAAPQHKNLAHVAAVETTSFMAPSPTPSYDEAEVMSLIIAASAELQHPLEEAPAEKDPSSPSSSTVVKAQPAGDAPATSTSKPDMEIMETELTCSICSELFIKAVTLNCAHTFCRFCIDQWRKTKNTCPICRKNITSSAPTLVLDNFIAKILETQSDEMKETRRDILKQRDDVMADVSGPSSSGAVANHSVIEILSEDDEYEDSDNSDYQYRRRRYDYDWDEDYDDEEDWLDEEDYTGLPGQYYGGYGTCYSCGERGHWANGCPKRRRT